MVNFWLYLKDIDYASTSLFQEQKNLPLCIHTWMLLGLAIFGPIC